MKNLNKKREIRKEGMFNREIKENNSPCTRTLLFACAVFIAYDDCVLDARECAIRWNMFTLFDSVCKVHGIKIFHYSQPYNINVYTLD